MAHRKDPVARLEEQFFKRLEAGVPVDPLVQAPILEGMPSALLNSEMNSSPSPQF